MNKSYSYLKLFKLAVPIAALSLVSCEGKAPPEEIPEPRVEPADLVLINGGIYTVDAERSLAEAAAIRDGVFVMVGGNSDVETLVGPETRTIDLAGRWALPGFHDAHVHPTMGGYGLLGCDLSVEESIAAIIAKVTECAGQAGDGWLEGHAFDLSLFDQHGPHKSLLDAIDTERPIILWGSDGHNAWASSRARALSRATNGAWASNAWKISPGPPGSSTPKRFSPGSFNTCSASQLMKYQRPSVTRRRAAYQF